MDKIGCFFALLLTATRGTKTKKYEIILQIRGGGEKLLSLRSKTFFTAIIAAVTISSCSNEETFNNDGTTPMTVKVNNNISASRSLVTDNVLPAGSTIGVMVYEDGKTTYDNNNCINIPYSTTNGTSWAVNTGSTAPKLSSTAGKTIAYYPWAESVTDFTQIPVSTGNTDYMYSNEVDVSFANHEATYNMTHALAGIRLTVKKNSAHPDMSVTKVTAQSDGFATSAKLDATTGLLASVTGSNETLTFDEDFTTTEAGKVIGFVAVPATSASSVTFMVETDGDTYTATASMTEAFKQGYIYDYTLTFNAAGMTLSSVAVNAWENGGSENLDLQKYVLTWENAPNGVYAVAADGSPVQVDKATSECIAVALIQGPHKFMIEKNETANTTSIKAAYDADGASNTNYKNFYGGMHGSDNTSITNYTQTGGGGTSSYGYLPKADGTYQSTPNLSGDYTTWTSGALSDFNGKANTAALLAASDTDSYTEYANMATWCRIFNQTAAENQDYTDWYIPAIGQLALMYLNMTAINNALTKIGGQTISSNPYWSSSEKSSDSWDMSFNSGYVGSSGKGSTRRVRFVRDF